MGRPRRRVRRAPSNRPNPREAIHYSIDFATRGYAGHSHGCVNIRDKTALAWLFDQVPVGTPVTIWS